MKKIHSVQRAEERYYIDDFKPNYVLREIMDDKCVLMKTDQDRFSNTFMMLYNNKYIKVVTDLNLEYIKTVLPLNTEDFGFIENLIQKLSQFNQVAA